MERKIMFLIGAVLILIFSLIMVIGGFTFTGKSVFGLEEDYSYTKAICNFDNECIDVLIECENGRVKSLEPVSGLVKFGKDWRDFREKGELC